MNVKVMPGYKQTEVGVIPEDWEIYRIGAVCRLINGRGFKPFEWKKTGLPIIRIQNLNGSDDFNCYQGSYDKKLEVEPGQLLFAWSGSRGTSFGPHIWKGPLGLLNYHTWKVVSNETEVNKKFLFHALRQLTAFIEGEAHGASALVHTQKWEMEGFQFPSPPTLAEQEAIAEALSDADALIESLEQLIAKKRQIKQGAMQELLTGKKRLPGFSGDWEIKRLGDVSRITTGKKDVNEGNPTGQFPFFTCSRAHTYSDSYSFDTEAILIAGNGDVGNLHYHNGKFEAYQRTYVLYDFSMNVSYLWQQLDHRLADSLGLGKIGSSIPYIKRENLTGFEFDSPIHATEQTAIAAILSDMDAEIAALEAKLTKARQLKQGMMQELLTGRIRLI